MNILQDRIRGSLVGGAIGDALGYPVEFIYSFGEIQKRYGERGITRLDTMQHWLDEPSSCSTTKKQNWRISDIWARY